MPFKNLKFLFLLFCSMIFIESCNQTTTPEYMFTNELIHESSPYLLHHAHNPVNWVAWNDKSLKKANDENKLMIISIGYAACHWCHVMEKESFSDSLVAGIMNESYVSIKIDREERPDIDQIYMDAAILTNGSGGWPLNVIALPDGRPVFAGTYFPKDRWIDILSQLNEMYKNNPQKLYEVADQITNGIRDNELSSLSKDDSGCDLEFLKSGFNYWMKNIDFEWGGYKRAPKFPLPTGFRFMLEYYYLTNDEKALEAVTTTLNRMGQGGIYDPIGGGFARYSVDEYWKVPHFEKMLYDNAQLISLYSYAYQLTKNPYYKKIVEQTIEFSDRELSDVTGLFYSSLDADSEGEEGKFYVWEYEEVKQILKEDTELIAGYFDLSEEGNWEDKKNILFATNSYEEYAEENNLSSNEFERILDASLEKLFNAREARIRPGLDDKCITAWNGLMVSAYVDAYRVLDNPEYLERAKKAMQFILEKNRDKDYKLNRIYKNDKSTINGFLDDYAFTIQALIDLYEVTFEEKWIRNSEKFTEYAITHFYSETDDMFYYTSDTDPNLIARKMEIPDNVIPSSNSTMANVLYKLGLLTERKDYHSKALNMLNQTKQQVEKGSPYYANWGRLYLWQLDQSFEVVIMGENAIELNRKFRKEFLPLALFAGSQKDEYLPLMESRFVEGQTRIYVCKNKTCNLPVNKVEEAIKQIKITR